MSEITIQAAHRECLELRRQLDAALRERDERRFEAERDEAQEAAEEYWKAWQESASFCEILAELNDEWRKKVERLECKLDTSRVANRLRQRRLDAAVAERDRLREALKRYGHHESGLDGCRYEGHGFGGPSCTCGLAEILKDTGG